LASLQKHPPKADARGFGSEYECETIVVDNSPWSPAITGVMNTRLGDGVTVVSNTKSNKFHASALDFVVENYEFDLLMALETDVLALRPDWLQWFVNQLKPTDFAVGHWHHEQFINPSCTLYRGDVLRKMLQWCKTDCPQDELRWGENFSAKGPLDNNLPLSENPASILEGLKSWICGPFAEKRGFPQGTMLKEPWSGQLKGPGWFEPGQQLHHWATNEGHTYTIAPTGTTYKQAGMPIMTFYGHAPAYDRQLEFLELAATGAYAVHLWGGTRALDILKHPVTCQFVGSNTPFWLEREARIWRDSVPRDVQEQTLGLIRKHGWHYRGQGTPNVTDRDREAAAFVQGHYVNGGIVF